MLDLKQLKQYFGNEQILAILLARAYFSTATKNNINDFIKNEHINWTLLYKIIRVHGLSSFIYYVIGQNDIDVNPVFKDQLQKRYSVTRLKNLGMAFITSKIINDLGKKGITIIPYKGPVFAHNYYKDLSLRESADIDFLVAKSDIDEIEDYFIENRHTAKTTVPKSYMPYYRKFFRDLVYKTNGKNPFSIEMHWRLMERFSGKYPDHAFFARHTEPCSLGGLQMHKLDATHDFLIVASNHFVKDMGIKFKYFVDAACMIKTNGDAIDHDVVFSTARKYRFCKRLRTGLQITNMLLGVELAYKPEKYPVRASIVKAALAFPLQLPRLYVNEYEFLKRSLLLQDSNMERVKFVFRSALYMFLPTYADINQFKIPSVFLPFLIISRPFRLLYLALKSKQEKKL